MSEARGGEWCRNFKIEQAFTFVASSQSNEQVEMTNKIIIQELKIKLEVAQGNWAEELLGVLWAYRTTVRAPKGQPHSI